MKCRDRPLKMLKIMCEVKHPEMLMKMPAGGMLEASLGRPGRR